MSMFTAESAEDAERNTIIAQARSARSKLPLRCNPMAWSRPSR